MVKGTKIGNSQHWGYRGRWNETKVKPQNWRFKFTATKKQNRKGHFPIKGRILWKINGYQAVVKTKNNQYQTVMWGKKRLLKKHIPKKR